MPSPIEPNSGFTITSPKARKDRKSTRLNSSHGYISYAVFCLKKKTRRRRALDAEFHRQVAAAARNPVHAAVTHALTALEIKEVAQPAELTPEDDASIIASHLAIHDAIARRDGDAARAAMHAHILDVERWLARGVVARAAS